jgi:hypothetical protein
MTNDAIEKINNCNLIQLKEGWPNVIKITNNIFFKAEERDKKTRGEKHVVGAPPCMGQRNAPHHHEGGGETHPMPSRHAVFFQRKAPHAPPKRRERLSHASACDAHADNFFFFFLIYSIQILNCLWSHTILTKKTLKKKDWEPPQY